MRVFSVESHLWNGEQKWFVKGYPTGRTSSCVQTGLTSSLEEAARWAEEMNDGRKPEGAKLGLYADD